MGRPAELVPASRGRAHARGASPHRASPALGTGATTEEPALALAR